MEDAAISVHGGDVVHRYIILDYKGVRILRVNWVSSLLASIVLWYPTLPLTNLNIF